ncbi:MAG: gluconate 2-dehydrogenase subunit 3 family protein [Bacteroidota bacterium]
MNRRQALQGILVVSGGVILFPKCEMLRKPIPVYENLTIDRTQFNLIKDLANILLPIPDLEISNPEPVQEFVLTMVNDCVPLEDCELFVTGLKEFQLMLQEKYNKPLTKFTKEDQSDFFEMVSNLTEEQKALKTFFDATLNYTKQHFMGSEYFLTKHLDWKFIPSGYDGCASV